MNREYYTKAKVEYLAMQFEDKIAKKKVILKCAIRKNKYNMIQDINVRIITM